MEPEYLAVRQALALAGYSDRPAASHDDIHATLSDIYHLDPLANEDFIDSLHAILKPAVVRVSEAETTADFLAQPGLKGCPDCGLEPTVTANGGINCDRHGEPYKVGVYCAPLAEAVVSWNDDEDWMRMGADPAQASNRPMYEFSGAILTLRQALLAAKNNP